MVFVVIQRRHKVPTFLFSRSDSLFLAYYSKKQKHANNHKITKAFFTINLDSQNQVIVLFLFFRKSNCNQL